MDSAFSDLWNLGGRHYLISGAASGIGRAIAILFDRLGAKLSLVDRDASGLEITRSICTQATHVPLVFDLRRVEEVDGLIQQAVASQGLLHGVIHSAGIQSVTPAKVLSRAGWQDIFAVNTESGLALAKSLHSKRVYAGSDGAVVFISSIMALAGSPGAIAYSMSKAALHGASRSLALEFASKGIRVNCIAPGYVQTPLLDRTQVLWSEEQRRAVESLHPLGFGRPEDIAHAAAFLCGDTGRWITGSVLVVDGGYLAQ